MTGHPYTEFKHFSGVVTLIFSKSGVYLLKDRDTVGLSASRSVGFPKWTVLIGRTGFDTIPSMPDPTLSLRGTRLSSCPPCVRERTREGETLPRV